MKKVTLKDLLLGSFDKHSAYTLAVYVLVTIQSQTKNIQ